MLLFQEFVQSVDAMFSIFIDIHMYSIWIRREDAIHDQLTQNLDRRDPGTRACNDFECASSVWRCDFVLHGPAQIVEYV